MPIQNQCGSSMVKHIVAQGTSGSASDDLGWISPEFWWGDKKSDPSRSLLYV